MIYIIEMNKKNKLLDRQQTPRHEKKLAANPDFTLNTENSGRRIFLSVELNIYNLGVKPPLELGLKASISDQNSKGNEK